MNWTEYNRWWIDNTDEEGELLESLPEPSRTLAKHVMALQSRVDGLMDADTHDQQHGRDCKCMLVACCCTYDYPDVVCMTHKPKGDS